MSPIAGFVRTPLGFPALRAGPRFRKLTILCGTLDFCNDRVGYIQQRKENDHEFFGESGDRSNGQGVLQEGGCTRKGKL
jgi:hypothetical protein